MQRKQHPINRSGVQGALDPRDDFIHHGIGNRAAGQLLGAHQSHPFHRLTQHFGQVRKSSQLIGCPMQTHHLLTYRPTVFRKVRLLRGPRIKGVRLLLDLGNRNSFHDAGGISDIWMCFGLVCKKGWDLQEKLKSID